MVRIVNRNTQDLILEVNADTYEHADLHGQDLSHAWLYGMPLTGANLQNANLTSADLSGAVLTDADLRGAILTDADLRYAVLDGTQFTGAFFRNTNLCFSMFLERATGLDQVQFGGHSYINQPAISAGIAIFPDTFLRGFGYSAAEIAAMRDARSATSIFASCFISYSHADETFAKKLHDRLVADGVKAWYAPKDILPGQKIHEQLSSAIQRHDKLILVLSQTSMASNWVRTEIRTARIRERAESKQMFFPVRVVPFESIRTWVSFFADDGLDLAQEVREYFIPDFSEWDKRNKFEHAYQLLLRGLRNDA